jgi:hypothetical protein
VDTESVIGHPNVVIPQYTVGMTMYHTSLAVRGFLTKYRSMVAAPGAVMACL